MEYDFARIEEKWRKKWDEISLFKTKELPEKKYYVLEMFAYPSGDIHIGHFRNYIIGDALARYKIMQGYDILHSFGWDAFGLPAEEAAIKRGIHPSKWTLGNIEISKNTLKKIGISYDWDREVATCLPDYYKQTQWLFLKLYQRGLAYQSTAWVNWCTSCKTVLANEQVQDGKCWRCESEVTKTQMKQWFFKITDYAERLLSDIDKLKYWPENVKTMQRNWIGKSPGVEIDFEIEGLNEKISVFTTRIDTIFGVTFMAIAPENPLVQRLIAGSEKEKEVTDYIEKARLKKDIERTAVGEKDGTFTGRYAINPLSGEKVQLWVADYVLATYATGIVMGVPAHDQRDFLFAKKYNIPIKVVINPIGKELNAETISEAYVDFGVMTNSGAFSGLTSEQALEKLASWLEKKKLGRKKINYKLRDWLVSRQRYWGAPIPIIYCKKCGMVPVPGEDLPILLPADQKDFIPKGRSPLADNLEFIKTKCPKCNGSAERDPDTLDTFVCSAWYYLRYTDPHNDKLPFDKVKADMWLPIDTYIGGIEHACGHLLYFRFIHKVLYDASCLSCDEPVIRLFNHGMVLDETGQIMSKSKGNVVSPVGLMTTYGTDVARTAMLFAAPSEREVLWSSKFISGANRFLNRVINFYEEHPESFKDITIDVTQLKNRDKKLYIKLNETIKRVSEDIERFSFNTAISALMELLNLLETIEEKTSVFYKSQEVFLKLLAPLAPYLAEELWERQGNSQSIFKSTWPEYLSDLQPEEKTLVIQINGKLRDRLTISAGLSEEAIKELALKSDKVKSIVAGKEVKKIIVVKDKLVNIVTG